MKCEKELKSLAAQLRYYSYRMDENPRSNRIHYAIAEEIAQIAKQYKDLIFNVGEANEQ